MTGVGQLFLGQESQIVEPRFRLADYLKEQYRGQRYATAQFAKDIGASAKTAENIFNATWPSSRHFQRIVRKFGRDVLAAVFDPDIDAVVARLKQEERDLERLLAEKRSRRLAAEGRDERAPVASEGTVLRVVSGGGRS